MSGLQTTLSCVTGASANVGQLVVIALLTLLVALHVATTIYSMRAAKSADESANNTRRRDVDSASTPMRATREIHNSSSALSAPVAPLAPLASDDKDAFDPGACATACGEACAGSDRIPIPVTCARACAAACGFHFV